MYHARPTLQRYDWGSTDDLPSLLGFEPDGGPYAEAWWGAHPGGAALVDVDGETRRLDDVIAGDPLSALGGEAFARFGRLPYLLKVLAIAQPLSIQVHPSLEIARAGFAREEAAGIPKDAPNRVYRDDNHKPEMVVALTPMVLLSGFREGGALAEDLARVGGPVATRLAALCGEGAQDDLSAYLRGVMTDDEAPGLVADLIFVRAGGQVTPNLAAAAKAAAHYPGDRGALVVLAMNLVPLAPGEACYTPDGIVHSYQSGVGLEIMANSDNVIRAGLTSKHVDVDALLEVAVTTPSRPDLPEGRSEGATTAYAPPVAEFRLSILEGGGAEFEAGPRMILALEGGAHVRTGSSEATLAKGGAVFVPDSDGPVTVESTGRTAVASVP